MDIKIGNFGQERDLICTEQEREIFERVRDEFPDAELRLVRVSDNYVSIKFGDWDILRLKYTNRAKWIMTPIVETKQIKHKIESVDEIEDFFASVQASIDHAKKYS